MAVAIQWIKENITFQKCYDMLKPGGYLAMFYIRGNYQTSNPQLYKDIQTVYQNFFATDAPYQQKFNYENAGQYGFPSIEKMEFAIKRTNSSVEY